MAMKQTQTKLFDFSDAGLDFSAGSKNLFPDRFKKILTLGFNVQTVTSVAVAGNQVTFTYGGAHGYVADRVLKVDSGALASINGGEFWIDSVTTNTVTITIDDAPISVGGGFTTRVASLGWESVYEQAHIHIYKFKHIDGTDIFARLCFQNATTAGNRNCIAVGIGRTVDLNSGHITDENCLTDLAKCATVAEATSQLRWDFTSSTARTFDNYTYAQGVGTFGKGLVVGSIYHIICMYSQAASQTSHMVSAILPFSSKYSVLNYPVLMCQENGTSTSTLPSGQLDKLRLLAGSIQCSSSSSDAYVLPRLPARSSYLPGNIDGFNTTTVKPLEIYTSEEFQFLGFAYGLGIAMYGTVETSPILGNTNLPTQTADVDFSSIVVCHAITQANTSVRSYVAVAVEEINGL